MGDIVTIAICITVVVVALSILYIVRRITDPKHQRDLVAEGWGKKISVVSAVTIPEQSLLLGSVADDTDEGAKEKIASQSETTDHPVDSAESDLDEAFWLADTADIETERWTRFKLTSSYESDVQFWTAMHLERRAHLGLAGALEELEESASQNPTWIWPLVFLSDRARDQAMWEKAETYLTTALARDVEKRPLVIARLVELRARWQGFDGAIALVTQLTSNFKASEKAAAFRALATATDDEDGSMGRQVFRELAVRAGGDRPSRFDLAYQYGEREEFSALAYRHYAKLISESYNLGTVHNNRGVLFGVFNEPGLRNDDYETAMDKGSALAACNLASQLVSAGFVKRAEMVLSSFSDYSGFESNKASTDGELAQAKKNLEDRKKSIRSKTTTNFDAFQTALSELEAWFYSDEKRPESLRYHNTDPELDLIVDQNFASASFSLEGVRFEGKLARNGIVYEGLIGQVGSTILSSVHRRMLLLPAPGHDISAVIFPPSSSGNLLVLRVKPTP